MTEPCKEIYVVCRKTCHQPSSPWWGCHVLIASLYSTHCPSHFLFYLILCGSPPYNLPVCKHYHKYLNSWKNHPTNGRRVLNRCLLWQLMVIVTLPMVCHISSTRWQWLGSQPVGCLSSTSQTTHKGISCTTWAAKPHSSSSDWAKLVHTKLERNYDLDNVWVTTGNG